MSVFDGLHMRVRSRPSTHLYATVCACARGRTIMKSNKNYKKDKTKYLTLKYLDELVD